MHNPDKEYVQARSTIEKVKKLDRNRGRSPLQVLESMENTVSQYMSPLSKTIWLSTIALEKTVEYAKLDAFLTRIENS